MRMTATLLVLILLTLVLSACAARHAKVYCPACGEEVKSVYEKSF